MSAITPVTKGAVTYAVFVDAGVPVDGTKFVTRQSDEFQVGILDRPTGYDVKPHAHPPRNDTITRATEFLYVAEGSAHVKVFDEEWTVLHERDVGAGSFMIFFRGGHALTMLQETRLIEVKQGPYPGDKHAKILP